MREKIFKLSNNIICAVAGITSDANILVDKLREIGARHKGSYGDDIPVEQLVRQLCDIKQYYTQVGGWFNLKLRICKVFLLSGKRPFGVSLVYAGWDPHHGFQLYQSDPSGNYTGWQATCIGKNHQTAVTQFKQDFKPEEMTLQKAKELAMKVRDFGLDTFEAKTTDEIFQVLSKTLDVKLAVDKVEMAQLTLKDGQPLITFLGEEEMKELIGTVEA